MSSWISHQTADSAQPTLSVPSAYVCFQAAINLERLLARRTRHGKLEYECKFWGAGHDENEWRSLDRLAAEGLEVACKRFDQVVAGVAAGLDLRPLEVADSYVSA